MWHSPFNLNLYVDFGGVISFTVKVWSWNLWLILWFIGVSRRDRRLNLIDSCNSRTSIGHARGCPRLPGHPNLTYIVFSYLSEGFLLKTIHWIRHISPQSPIWRFFGKNSQIGDFTNKLAKLCREHIHTTLSRSNEISKTPPGSSWALRACL